MPRSHNPCTCFRLAHVLWSRSPNSLWAAVFSASTDSASARAGTHLRAKPFESRGNIMENSPGTSRQTGPSDRSLDSFECKVCSQKFSNPHLLITHFNNHTVEFKCTLCEMTYRHENDLDIHLRGHDNPFKCNLCSSTFGQRLDLARHLYIHTGEKPFPCNGCDKKFYLKRYLRAHISRIHSQTKPFGCTLCSDKFKSGLDLRKHLKSHTKDKPLCTALVPWCTICNKVFSNRSRLRSHLQNHPKPRRKTSKRTLKAEKVIQESYIRHHLRTRTGEKPLECSVCNKKFRSVFILKNHLETHLEEENPFKCSVCGRKFSRGLLLKTHVRMHKGEKPFGCTVCNKVFSDESYLRTHIQSHT